MTRIAAGTDTVSRRIPASQDAVFRALTDPAMVARWLPPEGATATIGRFDCHPGGAFDLTLSFREDAGHRGRTGPCTDVVRGRFVEIDPPRRLVQEAAIDSDDAAIGGTMRIIWEVAPAPLGCELRVTCENVPPGIGADDHHAGLTSSLAQLSACVARP